MNKSNKLIIAAAGSGKTTCLVNEALNVKDENVLITTYTEANENEIIKKIREIKGFVPSNITIQTWFSFLLQHGVRPYQSILDSGLHTSKVGFYLTDKLSGIKYNHLGEQVQHTNPKTGRKHPLYWGRKDFFHYYFTKDLKIYSDKASSFIIECDNQLGKPQSQYGEIFNRLSRIYPNIFIDEVQDLAGWDLEIIKRLFETSSKILLVGDPRQVTYLTHHSRKYSKYKNGGIDIFIQKECKSDSCEIDYTTLKSSHRNNQQICDFSSQLFPHFESTKPCKCKKCRNKKTQDTGVFLVKKQDVGRYLKHYDCKPTVLRWNSAVYPEWNYGKSKGVAFDRVLIYPTKQIIKWLRDPNTALESSTKCKLYVAITRARYSVAFVLSNEQTNIKFDNILLWQQQ